MHLIHAWIWNKLDWLHMWCRATRLEFQEAKEAGLPRKQAIIALKTNKQHKPGRRVGRYIHTLLFSSGWVYFQVKDGNRESATSTFLLKWRSFRNAADASDRPLQKYVGHLCAPPQTVTWRKTLKLPVLGSSSPTALSNLLPLILCLRAGEEQSSTNPSSFISCEALIRDKMHLLAGEENVKWNTLFWLRKDKHSRENRCTWTGKLPFDFIYLLSLSFPILHARDTSSNLLFSMEARKPIVSVTSFLPKWSTLYHHTAAVAG